MKTTRSILRTSARLLVLSAAAASTYAQQLCPIQTQCPPCPPSSVEFVTSVLSDSFGPAVVPFGQQTLVVPKFDQNATAALHGVAPSEISLIGVELQAEFEVQEVEVRYGGSSFTDCAVDWQFDISALVAANPGLGTPDLSAGMAVSLQDSAIIPAVGSGGAWNYEWFLSSDGGGPIQAVDCYSTTSGLSSWVASGASPFASFELLSSSLFTSITQCGGLTTSASNSCSMTLRVQYHYCLAGLPTLFSFCFGDGAACPCGNDNDGSLACGWAGCANSVSSGGAQLVASGSTSVALDDLSLQASGLVPGQPGLFFQGTQALNNGQGVVFGDGLRCVGGFTVRLGVDGADAGGFSSSQGLNLAQLGGVAAGDVLRYQLWYRDPNASPCGSGFNLTNAVEVHWQP